jgi:hypothetical protein
MGFVAAVGLAFGSIVAAEKLDTTFHSVDDLRSSLNVPTLATLRLIRTKADARRDRRRFVVATAVVVASLAMIGAAAYYVADDNEQIVKLTARSRS